jgi:hypothetical protein
VIIISNVDYRSMGYKMVLWWSSLVDGYNNSYVKFAHTKGATRSLKSHINRQYNGKKGQKDKPMIYKTLYRKVKI